MTGKLEVREQETLEGVEVTRTDDSATVTEGNATIHVESHVFALQQAGTGAASEDFTRNTFEDALDKVSRPLKGRFAHVPYSSDDLIRDKKQDVELEDR